MHIIADHFKDEEPPAKAQSPQAGTPLHEVRMASPPQAPAHEEVKRSSEPGAAAAKGSRSGNSSMVGLPPKSNQTLDKKFKNFVKNSFKTNKK